MRPHAATVRVGGGGQFDSFTWSPDPLGRAMHPRAGPAATVRVSQLAGKGEWPPLRLFYRPRTGPAATVRVS